MLIAALAVTLVGFILLVVALVISSVSFAWACIAVCIVGVILLIADTVINRGDSDGDSDGDADVQLEDAGAAMAPEESEEQVVAADSSSPDGGAPRQDGRNPWAGPQSE